MANTASIAAISSIPNHHATPTLHSPTDSLTLPSLSSGLAPPGLALNPEERRLFCSHTLATLKQMAEEKRNASEDKKEELRQLVGIRYRVLIETADSIASMYEISRESKRKFEFLQDSIPSITTMMMNTNSTAVQQQLVKTSRDGSSNVSPSSYSQLHLLLLLRSYCLSPTLIWSLLDSCQFEKALLLLAQMEQVRTRIETIEFFPVDSQKEHKELKTIIDNALQQLSSTPSSPPPSLAQSLSTFFHHHRSYYEEMPSLIHYTAAKRLHHRSLSSRAYADCLTTLALVHPVSDPRSRAQEMLSEFLQSKTKQIHDIVWSANQALKTFCTQPNSTTLSTPTSLPPSSPTPVLIHACHQLLLILQYTLLDLPLLFGSIHSDRNPHAAYINRDAELTERWKTTNINERLGVLAQKMASSADQLHQRQNRLIEIDAQTLKTKVEEWLKDIQMFLNYALSTHLLPYLLPPSTSSSRRRPTSSPSSQFAHLRASILRVANWEEKTSVEREGEKDENDEKTAKEATVTVSNPPRSVKDEEKQSNGEVKAITSSKEITPAEQARLMRKKMVDRWEQSCILLFGRSSASFASMPSSTPSLTSPLNLFDYFFLSPLNRFGEDLLSLSFERLTLEKRVARFLYPSTNKDKERGKDKKGKKKNDPSAPKKLLQPDDEEEEKEKHEEEKKDEKEKSEIASTSSSATSCTDLSGSREGDIHELVSLCRSQLLRLGAECRAIMDVDAHRQGQTASASTPRATTDSTLSTTALQFPLLYRYLHEELTPLVTKKYNQLVEKLVEQLKKKMNELERSLLSSMADVRSWRSEATFDLVQQSVFIGRVCEELSKQREIMGMDEVVKHLEKQKQRKQGIVPSKSSSASTAPAPTSLSLSLSSTSRLSFRIWSRFVATVLSEDFAENWGNRWLRNQVFMKEHNKNASTNYYKLLGSNKSHVGTLPLGLFLPVNPSPPITSLLFHLHEHYYRAFGFVVHPEVLRSLLTDIDAAIMSIIERKLLVKIPSTSVAAEEEMGENYLERISNEALLQCLFDVQYLFAMLRLPASSPTISGPSDLRARYSHLLSTFDRFTSSRLDQIDWVTSKATSVANISAAIDRAGMLQGILSKANPLPQTLPAPVTGVGSMPPTSDASSTAQAMPPSVNILPLAVPTTRVLPLSASLYPTKNPQPVTAAQVSKFALSSSGLNVSNLTSSAYLSAAATIPSALSSASTATTSAPSTSTSSSSLGGVSGLSFSTLGSNISSQLSLATANSSVHAKAIGDLGSSLLGKISSSSLWGNKKQ